MKRRSFMQYFAGLAAILGVPSVGGAAQSFGGKLPTAATAAASPGVISLESNGNIGGKHIIKVVGIGSAGRRAVNAMTCEKWQGVEFVCIDSDKAVLDSSTANAKLWLSPEFFDEKNIELDTMLLDCGAVSDVLRFPHMSDVLRGAHVVFIVAGIGGETGAFGSQNIAAIARGLGILTVALVTKPMKLEAERVAVAEKGLNALVDRVDSLIVVDNEDLLDELEDWGDPVSLGDVFETSNGVLRRRLGSIVELINGSRLCHVDFAALKAVLRASGEAMVGSCGPLASCSEDDDAGRLRSAKTCAEYAIPWVTMRGFKPTDALGILVSIEGDEALSLVEVDEVMKNIRANCPQGARIVFGVSPKYSRRDFFRVTVFATGFNNPGESIELIDQAAPRELPV